MHAKNRFLAEIENLARFQDVSETPLWTWKQVDDLRSRIQETVDRITVQCGEQGIGPGEFPAPSRRAFQLLSFLSADRNLSAHMESLRRMLEADPRVAPRLDHAGFLYRYERSEERIVLQVSEGFIGAPEEVLASLVRLAAPYTRKRVPRETVRRYSEGPAFARAIQSIETSGGADAHVPTGTCHDLVEVFLSVNRAYFDGKLSRPRLRWSERRTYREFGHYEPATDTVQISRTLDAPEVPRFVLEHVMHHELLHRWLGAESRAGQRRYHSAEFRRAERAFERYAEAERFLQRVSERRAS